MSRLFLVRHGQTDWNLECKYQGSVDIPLNGTGRAQAQQVAQKLQDTPFSAVYASPMTRAFETAELIVHGRSLPIQKEPNLREISFGALEGKKIEEVHAEYSQRILLREKLENREKLSFKIAPDVESGHEGVSRALPTLLQIARSHMGENVLVVTHGGIIHNLLVHLEDEEWSSFRIQNCEVVVFEYRDNSLRKAQNLIQKD